jgi:hypothetical protein
VLNRCFFGFGGLFLDLLFLGLGCRLPCRSRFRLARAALLVHGLGLEGEMALRAFDGPL